VGRIVRAAAAGVVRVSQFAASFGGVAFVVVSVRWFRTQEPKHIAKAAGSSLALLIA
jgi:hypothetical protein